MKIKSFFSQYLPVIISVVILTVCLAYAWAPPISPPPSGNVSAPINTGDASQSKTGDLNIGGGLKYWITKLGDSFALKNDSGEIKFIVGQDGNTGIGAMDPKNKLEVAGDIALQKYSTTDGEPRAIYVFGHKGTGAQYGMHLGYANNRWRTRIFAPTGRDITFGFHNSTLTNPTQADWSEKVIIRDNGNVGIGRSDPQAKLHVNGRIKALDPIDDNDVATKGYVDAAHSIPYIDWSDCQVKSLCKKPHGGSGTISCDSGYVLVDSFCEGYGDGYGSCKLTDVNSLYINNSTTGGGSGGICGSIKCCKYIKP